MMGPRPSWRSYLRDWADADRKNSGHNLTTGSSTVSGGRLSGLRGPIRWLATTPLQQTADGHLVGRVVRQSWGRDGAWIVYPGCRLGATVWTPEAWVPALGWVRVPAGLPAWRQKPYAVVAGFAPQCRPCGYHELITPRISTRHIRVVLVHWRASADALRASGVSAGDLVPLLASPEAEVRQGALEALPWVTAP